jgi:hypothetical protein
MAIQTIETGVPGVNVYYVPPPNDIGNAFAAFAAAFMRERTAWATDLYYRRLDAQDPSKKAKMLLDLEKLRAESLAESGRNARTMAELAMSEDRDATLVKIEVLRRDTAYARMEADLQMAELEARVRVELAGELDPKATEVVAEQTSLLAAAAEEVRRYESTNGRQGMSPDAFAIQFKTSMERVGREVEKSSPPVKNTASKQLMALYASEIQRSTLSQEAKAAAIQGADTVARQTFGAAAGQEMPRRFGLGVAAPAGLGGAAASITQEAAEGALGGGASVRVRREGPTTPMAAPPTLAAPAAGVAGPRQGPAVAGSPRPAPGPVAPSVTPTAEGATLAPSSEAAIRARAAARYPGLAPKDLDAVLFDLSAAELDALLFDPAAEPPAPDDLSAAELDALLFDPAAEPPAPEPVAPVEPTGQGQGIPGLGGIEASDAAQAEARRRLDELAEPAAERFIAKAGPRAPVGAPTHSRIPSTREQRSTQRLTDVIEGQRVGTSTDMKEALAQRASKFLRPSVRATQKEQARVQTEREAREAGIKAPGRTRLVASEGGGRLPPRAPMSGLTQEQIREAAEFTPSTLVAHLGVGEAREAVDEKRAVEALAASELARQEADEAERKAKRWGDRDLRRFTRSSESYRRKHPEEGTP